MTFSAGQAGHVDEHNRLFAAWPIIVQSGESVAAAVAAASSGDRVFLAPGVHVLSTVVTVPDGVGIIGAGRRVTTLSCNASGQLRFGTRTTSSRHPDSGDFTISGTTTCPIPLYIGYVIQTHFFNLRVIGGVTANVHIQSAQNVMFTGLEVTGSEITETGIWFDNGVNNISLFSPTVIGFAEECYLFSLTDQTNVTASVNPRRVQVFGGLTEVVPATGNAAIHIRAAIDCSFMNVQTSTAATALRVDGGTVYNIRFHGGQLRSTGGPCVSMSGTNADNVVDVSIRDCFIRTGTHILQANSHSQFRYHDGHYIGGEVAAVFQGVGDPAPVIGDVWVGDVPVLP